MNYYVFRYIGEDRVQRDYTMYAKDFTQMKIPIDVFNSLSLKEKECLLTDFDLFAILVRTEFKKDPKILLSDSPNGKNY